MIEPKYRIETLNEVLNKMGEKTDNKDVETKEIEFNFDEKKYTIKGLEVEVFFSYDDLGVNLLGFNPAFSDKVFVNGRIGYRGYDERMKTIWHELGHSNYPLRTERENRLFTRTDY